MMMLGDGTRGSEYCSQNKKKIEFIQKLCLFLGMRCNIGKGIHNFTKEEKARTYISQSTYCGIIPKMITKEKYNGIIWCPSTKNKTWIARRNNKCFITGNSFRHFMITELKKLDWTNDKISKLTGHKSVASLAAYDHVLASDIKEEATRDLMRI
jgi:integrase